MTKSKALKELNLTIKKCSLCIGMNIPGCTENAPGYGNPYSKIMMIGQSLCTECMGTQIPFTGGSGLILDEIFSGLGITKKDIFITNVVHCHPPGNRPSNDWEISNCKPYLLCEITIVEPKLIIVLGADARRSVSLKNNILLYPVYHPAYYFRQGGVKAAGEYIKDLVEVMKPFI